MPRRSSSRRFRPSGVGNYTATNSRPFNDRFFEELDARLAQQEAAPAVASLSVRLGDVDPLSAVSRVTNFAPARA